MNIKLSINSLFCCRLVGSEKVSHLPALHARLRISAPSPTMHISAIFAPTVETLTGLSCSNAHLQGMLYAAPVFRAILIQGTKERCIEKTLLVTDHQAILNRTQKQHCPGRTQIQPLVSRCNTGMRVIIICW